MPRKFRSTAGYLSPDPRYQSKVLSKFVNFIMLDGKKSTATRMVYDSLDNLKKRFPESEPLDIFQQAINNVKPQLEVKSRRVGGANYQVPVEVKPRRAQYLAFKWIIDSARKTKGKTFTDCLTNELGDAFKKEGSAVKKKEDTHRMADANRAFAHFAF